MAESRYDVVIVGAGPAGATAAVLLARKGRSVALVDRDSQPRTAPCAGWLSAKAESLLLELRCTFPKGTVTPFSRVDFYNADCTKHARPRLEKSAGYLVRRQEFDETLRAHAASLDVALLRGHEIKDIRLNESSVTLFSDNLQITGRLLLLATGRAPDLPIHVGFRSRASETAYWVAQVDGPGSKDAEPGVAVILGLDTRGSFGFCASGAGRTTLSVHMTDQTAVTGSLIQLCRLAAQRGIMPADCSALAAQAKPLRCAAGWALDMDTHIAKHTLLIGDAGGFIAAASNEGLFPAMWSAQIAAEVVDSALKSPFSQDELMAFDSQWRMQIADHLRSPHTDIRFLLPLIFSNQAMADRMASAFFFGENI